MDYRRLLARTVLALLVAAGLVAICFFFVDRPVAYFVHETHVTGLAFLTTPVPWAVSLAPIVAALVVVVRAWRPWRRAERVALAVSLNLIATVALKDDLKVAFGRTWPETWIDNNPSLITDGVYGFFPFHGGDGYASFPSGHTSATFAVVSVLWLTYPRGRVLYALAAAAVMVGLVGMDYHFTGDVVAGAFLGSITGAWTVALFGLDANDGAEPEPP